MYNAQVTRQCDTKVKMEPKFTALYHENVYLHGFVAWLCKTLLFCLFKSIYKTYTKVYKGHTGKCILPENQNCSHIHVRKPYEDSMFAYNSYFDSI